jgi:hypothetical protein
VPYHGKKRVAAIVRNGLRLTGNKGFPPREQGSFCGERH